MTLTFSGSNRCRSLYQLTLATVIIVAVTACSTTGELAEQPADKVETQQPIGTEADVEALLAEAKASPSPRQEALLLQAAELLFQLEKLNWARNLLNDIDPSLLRNRQFIDYTLLFSEIALADDAYFLAQRILTNPRLDQQWQLLNDQQQVILRQRRADVFMLLGEPETSIGERLQLQTLLPPQSPEDFSNQDNLWQSLLTMPASRLEELAKKTRNSDARGWYSLALISKNNQSNLEKQLEQVKGWLARWPQHPASQRLPRDLRLLQQLIAERPQQVALLLPQRGRLEKAGNAVRDGFMAAFYQSRLQRSDVPLIKTYDTSEGDILAIYQQAVDEGAQLVIGPLDKANVAHLNTLAAAPVPTLAVNYADEGTVSTPRLYQFGLATEDEARQTAQRAWIEGHRNAMILANSEPWSSRSAEVFRNTWLTLGGSVIADERFSDNSNFSGIIGNALQIRESEERAKTLRGVLRRSVEFEPRRRQDVDMLFLVARPPEARQIKPTLAFHYASRLPVYATSHVYDGESDSKSDRDLNGIRFSTLPWYFDKQSPEKRDIQQTVKPASSYQRLYALGVDSYHLYPRLQQLEQTPQARFYGLTGSLSLSPERRIERDQVWAQIVNGRARPLPSTVSQD